MRDVIAAFESALDAVEQATSERAWLSRKEDWDQPYTTACERLLYTLFEHLEHCRGILTCLVPDNTVLAKHAVVREYDKGVQFYRNHLGAIVNKIKHSQRRVRGFVMYDDRLSVPGYYLEMVGVPGTGAELVMHPDPSIHSDGNTAISVNRDFRFHFTYLYLVGRHLDRALSSLGLHAEESALAADARSDSKIFAVASRLAELPVVFFPDEISESVPAVGVEEVHDVRRIWVDYPSNRLKPATFAEARFSISFTSDGATRVFKVPYSPKGISSVSVGARRSREDG